MWSNSGKNHHETHKKTCHVATLKIFYRTSYISTSRSSYIIRNNFNVIHTAASHSFTLPTLTWLNQDGRNAKFSNRDPCPIQSHLKLTTEKNGPIYCPSSDTLTSSCPFPRNVRINFKTLQDIVFFIRFCYFQQELLQVSSCPPLGSGEEKNTKAKDNHNNQAWNSIIPSYRNPFLFLIEKHYIILANSVLKLTL